MGTNGISEGAIFHNHPNGTCGYCVNMTETLLPENAKLTVVPPEGAQLKPGTSRGATTAKTFEGKSNTPKEPSKPSGGCPP